MERNDTEVIFGIPTPSKITEVAASAVAQVRVRASAAAQGWCFCCPRIVSTLDASWSKIARSITELEVRLSAHLEIDTDFCQLRRPEGPDLYRGPSLHVRRHAALEQLGQARTPVGVHGDEVCALLRSVIRDAIRHGFGYLHGTA